MGCCQSTSEQSTKTAPLSKEGREWNSLYTNMTLASLSDIGGYDVTPTEKTEYKNPEKAAKYEANIAAWETELAGLSEADLKPQADAGMRGGASKKQKLETKIAQEKAKLEKSGKVTFTDYQIKKKEDPRVQQAIDQFGPDSDQVKNLRGQIQQTQIDKATSMETIERDFLKNTKKFVSGDMTYTPEQEKQVDAYFGPVRDIITKTTDDLLRTAGDNYQTLRGDLDNLATAIDSTGFKVSDALRAAEIQIDKTGDTLLGVLTKVNQNSEARARFQFDLLSEEIDTKTAQQNALLGLPPGSQSEKLASLKMKQDALKSIELDLTQNQLQGELGITEKIGDEKKTISMARVALESSHGEKKEGLAQSLFNLDLSFGDKKESILGQRGNALLATEQSKQSQLLNAAYGNIPMMMQAMSRQGQVRDLKTAGKKRGSKQSNS